MLAIMGPYNAPSHALKGEEVNDISCIAKALSGLGRYCKYKYWTTIGKSIHSRNRSCRMSTVSLGGISPSLKELTGSNQLYITIEMNGWYLPYRLAYLG